MSPSTPKEWTKATATTKDDKATQEISKGSKDGPSRNPEDEQDEDPKKSTKAGNVRKARKGMREASVTPLPAEDDQETHDDFEDEKDHGKLGKQAMDGAKEDAQKEDHDDEDPDDEDQGDEDRTKALKAEKRRKASP